MAKIIVTTGNFNLILPHHVYFLEKAKSLGDKLVVLLDSSKRNKELKKEKAILDYYERQSILSAIKYVDDVLQYDGTDQLSKTLYSLKNFQDSVLFVKGADYNLDTMDQKQKEILDKQYIPIAFIPVIPGSTTNFFEKMKEAYNGKD